MIRRFIVLIAVGLFLIVQSGCIGFKTFPYTVQAGSTITLGGGLDFGLGNEFMDRSNTKITITKDDDPGFGTRDITTRMRSLFQLYPDPLSHIWNYNAFLGPLSEGRPFETGIVLDLPTYLLPGDYTLHVSSSKTFNDWHPKLRIVNDPNVLGSSNCFQDQSGFCNDITVLERQRYVRVEFKALPDEFGQVKKLGALEVVLNTDPLKVPMKDINVVLPRINFGSAGFGTTNRDHLRMLHWMPENLDTQIRVSIVCPKGVDSKYLFFDVVFPRGRINPIDLTKLALKAYDIQGGNMTSRVDYLMALH